ncbi:MAG: DUF2589 domain-containing protein [Oscillospiraceae bacterium]|nr:DUF2589 domain-containing protein [Oscillospiraceae bacterium]
MSSVGDQFKGLDMKNLIGGPLTAAAESSILLARSTADFINDVGFDSEQKTRNVLFKYQRNLPDPDGNVSNQEMAVEVPLLAIVPIPNLQIDEVNIVFDMEVKTSERSEDSLSASAKLSANASFGPVKVSITGSVSTSKSNTRSSDNSAKYHVDVRATNHGIPEGLARVLDMMAASVAPNVLSSKAVDSNGKALTGKSRERNQTLKSLREKRFQLESSEAAARDSFDMAINDFIKQADSKQGNFHLARHTELNNAKDDKEKSEITNKLERNAHFWDDFKAEIKSTVMSAAAFEDGKEPTLESLKAADAKAAGEENIAGMQTYFAKAIKDCRTWEGSKKALDDNKEQYNAAMMDVDTAAETPKPAA